MFGSGGGHKSGAGARPIIRPPRSLSKSLSEDEAWAKLAGAIRGILNKNAGRLSFEELYRTAYNMVIRRQGLRVYLGVQQLFAEHLEARRALTLAPLAPTLTGAGPPPDSVDAVDGAVALLEAIKREWDDHQTTTRLVRDVLMYVDDTFVKGEMLHVQDVALRAFTDRILQADGGALLSGVTSSVLAVLQRDRRGESVERLLLRAVLAMLQALPYREPLTREQLELPTSSVPVPCEQSCYSKKFEPALLAVTTAHFRTQSLELLEGQDLPVYIRKTAALLDAEMGRAQQCFASETLSKIERIVLDELLAQRLDAVFQLKGTGLAAAVNSASGEKDLGKFYAMLVRTPGGSSRLSAELGAYWRQALGAANSSAQADGVGQSGPASVATQWVGALLEIQGRMDALLERAFEGDRDLVTASNTALLEATDANARSPEFLSLYLDDALRKAGRQLDSDAVEAAVDRGIVLLRFVQDKDLFERYYKKHLARRLLLGRQIAEDLERLVLHKLKVECGQQFTAKLESMFADIGLSRDLSAAFGPPQPGRVALHVSVLNSNTWPTAVMPSNGTGTRFSAADLPGPMAREAQAFEKFYVARHTGRQVQWCPHLGNAEVRVQFAAGPHELQVSTFMLFVLTAVWDSPEADPSAGVRFSRIQEVCGGLPDADLRRTLLSLALGKHRVLVLRRGVAAGKRRSTDNWSRLFLRPDDEFAVNLAFQSPTYKVRIATITSEIPLADPLDNPDAAPRVAAPRPSSGLATAEEQSETQRHVADARKQVLDAAIVRTMKARRTLGHNELVAEIIRQLGGRFQPAPQLIKERIEDLITREYLARDASDRRLYVYQA